MEVQNSSFFAHQEILQVVFLGAKRFPDQNKWGPKKTPRKTRGVFGREVLQRLTGFLPNESLVLVGWRVARKRHLFIKDAQKDMM